MNIEIDEEKGEIICPKCNGKRYEENGDYIGPCQKCLGEGKLDWIENITGKEETSCDSTSTIFWSHLDSINSQSFVSAPQDIDYYLIKRIKNEITEQILNNIDKIIEKKLNNILIRKGIEILNDN